MRVLIIVLAILFLLVLAMAISMALQNSRIPSNIGVKQGVLAPLPSSPNAVSSQTDDPEKRVDPFPFKGSLAETKDAIKQALSAYGDIEIKEEGPDYIHAVSTTARMKYNDDLEFYFDQENRLVHFRSASRVGYSDMGLNRERYEKLLELYE